MAEGGGRSRAETLRVGLELTACQLDRGGTARAAQSLRLALTGREDVDVVPVAHPGTPRHGTGGRVVRGLSRELSWLPVRLPLQTRRLGLDLLHCPAPVVPSRSAVPVVVTLFDALPWRHPEWLTRSNVASHRLMVRRRVRRAAAVITASEHARGEIAEAYDLSFDRIHVVPLGVDSQFSPGEPPRGVLDRLGLEGPFALTVGTMQPRKNIEGVLSAFERLVDQGADLSLVIAGGAGWGERATAERIRRSSSCGRVVLTGHVDDTQLLALYRSAQCFVFPSRYEGFGLPVLEAMAAGAPVICSNQTSLPEVAGDAAILVSPDDIEGLESAIGRVISSSSLRTDLIARGSRQAAPFTWDRCARGTAAVYRAVVNGA